MSKAKITFNLNDPEDKKRFEKTVLVDDMSFFIFEIKRNLFKRCKRICENKESKDENLDVYDGLEIYKDEINKLLEYYNLNNDKI